MTTQPVSDPHRNLLDTFKRELLIVFLRRLGGKLEVPVEEVDDTKGIQLRFRVVDRVFHFELRNPDGTDYKSE